MNLLDDIDVELGIDMQGLRGAQLVLQDADMGVQSDLRKEYATCRHNQGFVEYAELYVGLIMDAGEITYDTAIVGGGPAGASCALWLARLGYRPALIDAAPEIGGLCRSHPFPDCWNASLPDATGPQVADNLARSIALAAVPMFLGKRVARVQPTEGGFFVQAAGGFALRSRYLVLATGVRARTLPALSGVEAVDYRRPCPGILVGPGSHIVEQSFQGLRVAVLGGGDNAFENALYVREHGASEVRLYARTVRAQRQFVERFPAKDVLAGDYTVDVATLAVNGQPYDLILVFYGWEPCADYAGALNLRRGRTGFIDTDISTAQASFPGVYAIGEVAQRLHPCVVTAMADGITAAKAIQARLEAQR